MNERVTLSIVGAMVLAMLAACYIAWLGHSVEAKEIIMMVVSSLAGAIGGHAAARVSSGASGKPDDPVNVTPAPEAQP